MSTGDILRQALAHHQAGRLELAEGLYAEVLAADPANPDALHFLGLLAHQQGDHAAALARIADAIAAKPDAASYHNNMGSVLAAMQRNAEAEAAYRRALDIRADYAEAHCNLGGALHKQGRLDEALAAYRRALDLKPDYAEAHGNLGSALTEQGDTHGAEAALRRAIAIDPAYADAHNNLANLLQKKGEFAAAEAEYRRAIQARPDYAEAHCNLGTALEAEGRLEDAAASHQRAIDARPDYARAHTELANVRGEQGRDGEAEAGYRRALEGDPAYAPAHAGLASLWERASRLEEAAAAAEAALAREPDNVLAAVVAAKCARRAGDAAAGLMRLGGLDLDRLDAASRAAVGFELGSLHDRGGDYAAAYAAYVEANQYNARHWRALASDAASYPDEIGRLRTAFTASWLATWSPPVAETAPAPAFLVGFPRSGTTLLDRVLDTHPSIATIEEQPILSAIVKRVAALPGGYPDGLAGLDANDIAELRQEYFEGMAEHIDDPDAATVVVDKLPLNITDVGVVHRLFPSARIVLALRHPCDCVLSGFMQPFRPNRAMVHFASLDGTARLYGLVMGLWQIYAEVLPLAVHVVRYEDLVADFDSTISSVLAFLGLDWDDAVRDYAAVARQRGSATPSYHQVVQPIYNRSVERWRNYRQWLEPLLPVLDPFIADFGYPPADAG